jgi:hypothetical protein
MQFYDIHTWHYKAEDDNQAYVAIVYCDLLAVSWAPSDSWMMVL